MSDTGGGVFVLPVSANGFINFAGNIPGNKGLRSDQRKDFVWVGLHRKHSVSIADFAYACAIANQISEDPKAWGNVLEVENKGEAEKPVNWREYVARLERQILDRAKMIEVRLFGCYAEGLVGEVEGKAADKPTQDSRIVVKKALEQIYPTSGGEPSEPVPEQTTEQTPYQRFRETLEAMMKHLYNEGVPVAIEENVAQFPHIVEQLYANLPQGVVLEDKKTLIKLLRNFPVQKARRGNQKGHWIRVDGALWEFFGIPPKGTNPKHMR